LVRRAVEADLKTIASIHNACFPSSISTMIGRLDCFYSEYLKRFPNLFFVVENLNNEIVGFCVGYRSDVQSINKQFKRNNKLYIVFRIFALILSGRFNVLTKIADKVCRKKHSVITNPSYIGTPLSQTGDLMSICILPEYRGNGMAGEMLDSFLNELRNQSLRRCILTVDTSNERGIAFYLKHHFVPYRMIDGQSVTLALML